MDLFEENPRAVTRDRGEKVLIASIPLTKAYTNTETDRLSREYDVQSHNGAVPSSLGSANTECYAANLFRAYSFVGRFCGFEEIELRVLAEQTRRGEHHLERLTSPCFLVSRYIEGSRVLFPTENFLKNQRIKKRNNGLGE